ncbi:hypothetical protein BJX62DRAFT_117878 [Aspergillus germanicus]
MRLIDHNFSSLQPTCFRTIFSHLPGVSLQLLSSTWSYVGFLMLFRISSSLRPPRGFPLMLCLIIDVGGLLICSSFHRSGYPVMILRFLAAFCYFSMAL